MAVNWLLLDSGSGTGHFNMALDNDLARKAALTRPVLRFYSWHPPAISVGFHQKTDQINHEKCRCDGIDIVRRPTGGRAILHAEEITYSLVIPQAHPVFNANPLDIYNNVSLALVAGLQKLGFPAEFSLQRQTGSGGSYRNEFACFATSAQYEVTCQGRKLAGSAQRRFKKSVLQHGSILTGDKHLQLPGYLRHTDTASREAGIQSLRQKTICLSDILNHVPSYHQLVTALSDGFSDVFRNELELCTMAELGHADIDNQLQSKSIGKLQI